MTVFRQQEVQAFAPATVANLGPGFDVLGLALEAPGDVVRARLMVGTGVKIVRITGDGGKLSHETRKNTAGIAAEATLAKAGIKVGVELELDKGLPIGSGLGSSGASAAAAAFAVNALVGFPLKKTELIGPCIEAEAAVAGRHGDNVAPCILGGLVLVRSVEPLDLVRLPVPEGLRIVVTVPEFELSTRTAREALPPQVPLGSMVRNSANLASFVSACHSGDINLLMRSLSDEVVVPARRGLIPGCENVIAAALSVGALGASISGAGPSMFAFCHSVASADRVASAMVAAFERAGLTATFYISSVDCPGVRRV